MAPGPASASAWSRGARGMTGALAETVAGQRETVPFPQRPASIRRSACAAFLCLAAALLTLSFAFARPQSAWIAWIALSPWLAAVAEAPSIRSASLWGWAGAVLFFG